MMTQVRTSRASIFRRGTAVSIVVGLALSVFFVHAGQLRAEENVALISHQRVRLGDVVSDVASGIANLDLGRAPPPGRSRYFSYEEMASRLHAAGISASRLKLPRGIRVESRARQFSTDELEQMVETDVQKSLPSGMHLERIKVESPLVLSPAVRVGSVRLPQFSAKNGEQTQTGTVEILWGDQVALRMPVKMSVRIKGDGAAHLVQRGASVTLLIRRGNVEISAIAQTLSTARVGEVISVRVGVTNKVMSGRLVTPDKVELEI